MGGVWWGSTPFFWTHYCMAKAHCSNLRIITAIFSGVHISRIFTVHIHEFSNWTVIHILYFLNKNISTSYTSSTKHIHMLYFLNKNTSICYTFSTKTHPHAILPQQKHIHMLYFPNKNTSICYTFSTKTHSYAILLQQKHIHIYTSSTKTHPYAILSQQKHIHMLYFLNKNTSTCYTSSTKYIQMLYFLNKNTSICYTFSTKTHPYPILSQQKRIHIYILHVQETHNIHQRTKQIEWKTCSLINKLLNMKFW